MAEYIDKQAAIADLTETYDKMAGFHPQFYNGYQFAVNRLRVFPTAVDAVEVVRCKDCKHWDNPICEVHSEWPDQYSTGHTAYMEPDDFCSYGERKDGGQAPQREDV